MIKLSSEDLFILNALYTQPELYGSRVVVYTEKMCIVLFEGFKETENFKYRTVVIEKTISIEKVANKGAIQTSSLVSAPYISTQEPIVYEGKATEGVWDKVVRLKSELADTGVSCTSAALSGKAIAASTVLTVPLGGIGGAIVTAALWTNLTTSSTKCIQGLKKIGIGWSSPEALEQFNKDLENNAFQEIIEWADTGSSLVTGLFDIKNLYKFLTTKGTAPTYEALIAMKRVDIKNIIRKTVDSAKGLNQEELIKTLKLSLSRGKEAKKLLKELKVLDNQVLIRLIKALSTTTVDFVTSAPMESVWKNIGIDTKSPILTNSNTTYNSVKFIFNIIELTK